MSKHHVPCEGERLLAHVRGAAEALVEDLDAAGQRTNQWSDQRQTDLLVHAALERCLDQLARSNCWGELNRTASNLLWQIAGDWLETGWMQRRAREKPRGYAGDYELLARIDNRFTSDHPLGRSLDAFFQSQAAPQAVRNRHQWLQRELVDLVRRRSGKRVHCVSVGCGPACEIKEALTELNAAQRAAIRVTLLDLDPAALDFAQRQLTGLLGAERIQAVRENLFRISRTASKAAVLKDADFLSCPGLFDYLDAANATALLTTFWEQLAPGGRMMVFNFTPRHPSQAYMEWIGNWYLTYRTQADLAALARASGLPADCTTIATKSHATDYALTADKPLA